MAVPPPPTPCAGARWRPADAAWALLAVGLAAWAQAGILGAYFFADDFLYLFRVNDSPRAELLLMPNAGHLLVLRNLLFLASWHAFGPEPLGYYATVYVTHLANVLLLFALVRRLTGASALAAGAAALWGCLAVHSASLAWYAVYGQVIAVALLAAVLLAVLDARAPLAPGRHALLALLLLGAGTCFGSAMAVALALPVALPILRPALWRGWLPPFVLTALLLVGLWALSQALYADPVHLARLVAAQPVAESTPEAQGLLASLRTLYLSPVAVLMGLDLVGHGLRAVLLGPLALSPLHGGHLGRVLLVPALLAAALAAWAMSPARRRTVLALALLLAAAYGSIAFGRAQIFTTLLDGRLPVMIERYHYLPTFFLVVLAALCADEARRRLAAGARRAAAAAVPVALAGLLAWQPIPHDRHDADRARVAAAVAELRARIAAAPPARPVLIRNRGVGLVMLAPPAAFPGLAALFVIFFPDNVVDGRRVRFQEHNPAVLDAATHGRRTATLFHRPHAAPAPPP